MLSLDAVAKLNFRTVQSVPQLDPPSSRASKAQPDRTGDRILFNAIYHVGLDERQERTDAKATISSESNKACLSITELHSQFTNPSWPTPCHTRGWSYHFSSHQSWSVSAPVHFGSIQLGRRTPEEQILYSCHIWPLGTLKKAIGISHLIMFAELVDLQTWNLRFFRLFEALARAADTGCGKYIPESLCRAPGYSECSGFSDLDRLQPCR